mmetsp:Transcript_44338/g.128980  ORF Transcript_44338/g.128980 Transcript_44338/m.128980 type:complete len:102 (+) Transcript_44338:441-746(+)
MPPPLQPTSRTSMWPQQLRNPEAFLSKQSPLYGATQAACDGGEVGGRGGEGGMCGARYCGASWDLCTDHLVHGGDKTMQRRRALRANGACQQGDIHGQVRK